MTLRSNLNIVLSTAFLVQYCCPVLAQHSNLLDLFGINTGQSGTVSDRIPTDDITRLRKPLPQVMLLDGIPSVPGIIGSFPGIGGCLLRRTPLVNQRSPSLFQNLLRFIPGAQDYLSDLVKTPIVDLHSLMGNYVVVGRGLWNYSKNMFRKMKIISKWWLFAPSK
uniref:Plug domain-containing protein n=1 Tax=Loa loa TaxID=7209 RepID=A0A1I7VDR4_LOALO